MRQVLLVMSAVMGLGLVLPEAVPSLCERSDAAVMGEVTTIEWQWTTAGGLETHAWVAVQQVVRGEVVGDTIELVWAGGRSGELVHRVEDQPELKLDRRYLLLLEERPDGRFAVTGGERGALPVPHGDDGRTARAALGSCVVP